MKLTLQRKTATPHSTIGEIYINGAFSCFTLEDRLRAPGVKIHGQTCIPAGTYQVAITMSNRFKTVMPLLVGVPNFSGVRIHVGNSAVNTEGCLLVGRTAGKDWVGESRMAYVHLFNQLAVAARTEKIEIEILNPPGWDAQFQQKADTNPLPKLVESPVPIASEFDHAVAGNIPLTDAQRESLTAPNAASIGWAQIPSTSPASAPADSLVEVKPPATKEISPQLIASGLRTLLAGVGFLGAALGLFNVVKLEALKSWVDANSPMLITLIGAVIVGGQYAWGWIEKLRLAHKTNVAIVEGQELSRAYGGVVFPPAEVKAVVKTKEVAAKAEAKNGGVS